MNYCPWETGDTEEQLQSRGWGETAKESVDSGANPARRTTKFIIKSPSEKYRFSLAPEAINGTRWISLEEEI